MKTKSLLLTIIATLGMTALTMAQNVPSYVPTNGLVGWWPFNGNANDESGNGNNGTVNGASLTTDRFGASNKAYNFNGSNSFIQVGDLDPDTNFTISCWINPVGNVGVMISKYNNTANSSYELIYNQSTRGLYAHIGLPYAPSDIPLTLNQFQHVVLLYSQETVKLYKNGTLIYSQLGMAYPPANNSSVNFGRSSWGGNTLNGKLDDIGIWNRALTQQEITALYTATPNNGGGGNNNTASASVPQGISYQAIARNTQGHTLSDTDIQVKFTLLADSLTGAAEYSESHSLATNSLGLFTTAFGAGTAEIGTFAGINWASGSKYLKVELDAGDGFVDMGTQQLLSVPFSMRSNTSAKAGTIENSGLPVYADNAAALAGGLVAGQMYRTATGDLKIVY